MKKLMTLMLGLSLVMGSVAVSFARQGDSGKKNSTRKGGGGRKKGDTNKGDKTGN
jgi:hypothetical protein